MLGDHSVQWLQTLRHHLLHPLLLLVIQFLLLVLEILINIMHSQQVLVELSIVARHLL